MKRTRLFGSNRNLKVLLLGLVAAFATAFGIVGYATDFLGTLEGNTVNTRFGIRGHEAPSKNIVMVNIDPKTFRDLAMQWPFPRAVDGRVISRVAAQHPAAIAFDVQLSEPSQLGQDDEVALLTDISNYPRKIVLSDTEPDTNGNVVFLGSGKGTALLQSVGAKPGEGSFPNESAGAVIRTMEYSISNLKTLAVVTAETANHKRVQPFKGQRWIDYRGLEQQLPGLVVLAGLLGHPER